MARIVIFTQIYRRPPVMRRRDFMSGLAASALLTPLKVRAQDRGRRPRLLISHTDPFTGLDLLQARYARGIRPSEDMEGWALSWLLTGKDSFADQALAGMQN